MTKHLDPPTDAHQYSPKTKPLITRMLETATTHGTIKELTERLNAPQTQTDNRWPSFAPPRAAGPLRVQPGPVQPGKGTPKHRGKGKQRGGWWQGGAGVPEAAAWRPTRTTLLPSSPSARGYSSSTSLLVNESPTSWKTTTEVRAQEREVPEGWGFPPPPGLARGLRRATTSMTRASAGQPHTQPGFEDLIESTASTASSGGGIVERRAMPAGWISPSERWRDLQANAKARSQVCCKRRSEDRSRS